MVLGKEWCGSELEHGVGAGHVAETLDCRTQIVLHIVPYGYGQLAIW